MVWDQVFGSRGGRTTPGPHFWSSLLLDSENQPQSPGGEGKGKLCPSPGWARGETESR